MATGIHKKNDTHKSETTSQTSIDALFLAFNKRRVIIFIVFGVIFLCGAIFYKMQSPIYSSTILLKKDSQTKQQNAQDQYNRMIADQSPDDIETELKLINTRVVLSKVVNQLNLNFIINKIQFPNGNEINFDESLTAYNWWLSDKGTDSLNYPHILDAKVDSIDDAKTLNCYAIMNAGYLELYDAKTNVLINSQKAGNPGEISTNDFNIKIDWHKSPPGTKIFFSAYGAVASTNKLNKKIQIAQVGKTNIIQISVYDKSPRMAQLIANTLTQKFIATRTEIARRNIQQSYKFVDKQLSDMAKQLKEAEDNVSAYKSRAGITELDQGTADIVKFLSGLQAQKIANDLELSQYESKVREIQSDFQSKGYFDQTFLAPDNSGQSNSPFSNIQKQLTDLEQQKIVELQKKSENHPDIISLNDQIAQLKEQMKSYNQNTLNSYNIIINSLKDKKANLENLIAKYQAKIHNVPQEEKELASLSRNAESAEKMFNVLLNKREELRVKEVSQLQDILVVDPADLPMIPASPSLKIIVLVCFFLWGAFSIAYVFVGEFRERRLLKLNEIEDDLQLPILSIIPRFPRALIKKMDQSKTLEDRFAVLQKEEFGIIESYKVLQTKLVFMLKGDNKIILFTSPEENSGKTTIVGNLALTLATAGKKVLIVDADLKRCGLTDLFEVSRENPGLSTFLDQDLRKIPIFKLNGFTENLSTSGEISFLPSGEISENSSNLLQSQKASDLINDLKSSFYDYILIDTPPVTRVIDTLILSRMIENTIMITRDNHTFRDAAMAGLQELRNEGINISGAIVNACEIEKSTHKYKYGYGYGYEYSYANKNGKSKVSNLKQSVYEQTRIGSLLNRLQLKKHIP
jgi:capsular exopolysaccharide synthesis family protein